MPTTRARHTITETDELAAWLDDAARQWPEDADSRSRLLLRLVGEGHRATSDERRARRARRAAAVRETAGALSGSYPPGYLDELREGWPG